VPGKPGQRHMLVVDQMRLHGRWRQTADDAQPLGVISENQTLHG
jgi:hypothetical protein